MKGLERGSTDAAALLMFNVGSTAVVGVATVGGDWVGFDFSDEGVVTIDVGGLARHFRRCLTPSNDAEL